MTASKLVPLTLITGVSVLLLLFSMVPPSCGSAVTVEISDLSFNPKDITVFVGDTVTWVNNDSLSYTLWFVDSQNQTYLISDPILPGDSWSYTFNQTIALTYFCQDRLWISGSIEVLPPGHDVAVNNVVPYKIVAGQGYDLSVSVAVADPGNYTETFNVTVYANTTYVTSQNVTLSTGNSSTLALMWDTTGFAYGNYTVSAYAWPVPGQTNTANNNCTDGNVIVTIPGDINGDGTVDIYDAILLAAAFGSTPGMKNWNPSADINGDGIVDIYDAIIVAAHFGQSIP